MSDEDEQYIARLEFRGDATYYDTETIRDALDPAYSLTHNVTSGSLELRRESYSEEGGDDS